MTEAQRLVAALFEGVPPKEFFRRLMARRPAVLKSQAVFRVDCEPEFMEPEGFFNPEDVREIRRQLAAGNEWAWCIVTVRATWWDRRTGKSYEGRDVLCGCSYASRADFMQPGGYFDGMKSDAYEELLANVEAGREADDLVN